MSTTTTVRSWGAICLGIFFALVTAYVLFSDVLGGAAITTGHVLALAALVAAIASGHMAAPALRTGAIIPGIMLVMLFVGGTGYVVVSSGARNAEQAGSKAAAIEAANKTRAHEEELLAKAEAMLAEAQADMARECASGRGKRCQGREATVNVYAAAIKGHKATLAALPAPQAPSGYSHAAKVLASWGLHVTDDWLALNMPFVTVLITELGTIAFLHLGLGHKRRPRLVPALPANDPLPPAEAPVDPVIDWVREFRRVHGRNPQIPEVQKRFPRLPKTTAWRRATAA